MGKEARLKRERRLAKSAMRKIEGLTVEEMGILKVPLETIDVRGVNTIADLRKIDKICKVIEGAQDGVIEMEDADYQYMIQRFQVFQTWNPAFRGKIMPLAEKIGV